MIYCNIFFKGDSMLFLTLLIVLNLVTKIMNIEIIIETSIFSFERIQGCANNDYFYFFSLVVINSSSKNNNNNKRMLQH